MITGDGPVALRAPRDGDRERWLELMADPDELAFGAPAFVVRPTSLAAMADVVATAQQRFGALEPGALTVVDRAEPERLLGTFSWRWDAAPPLRVADVGYGVHPDARGRGVATAALRLVARWLMHDVDGPGLARVQLDHSVENPASCRVALGAGFAREGVRRRFLPLREPGSSVVRRHDVCLHGRTDVDD